MHVLRSYDNYNIRHRRNLQIDGEKTNDRKTYFMKEKYILYNNRLIIIL